MIVASLPQREARWRDDAGFTLPEVLITVVMFGLVIAAASAALIIGLRTTDGVTARHGEAHDEQLLERYLVPDLNDASAAGMSVPSTCSGMGASANDVLRVDRPGTPSEVVYRRSAATLVRLACHGAEVRTTEIAGNVASASVCLAGSAVRLVVGTTSGDTLTVSSAARAEDAELELAECV